MSGPTCESILRLYGAMLRTSRSFSSYNFREYFVRRTKDTFRQIQVCLSHTPTASELGIWRIPFQNEKESSKVKSLYETAVKEHAVLQRSAIVNRLYGGWRLVVEKQKPVNIRGDSWAWSSLDADSRREGREEWPVGLGYQPCKLCVCNITTTMYYWQINLLESDTRWIAFSRGDWRHRSRPWTSPIIRTALYVTTSNFKGLKHRFFGMMDFQSITLQPMFGCNPMHSKC